MKILTSIMRNVYRYVEKFKLWPPIRPVYFAQNSFDAFFRVVARAHMIAFDCSGLIALREVHQLKDFFFVKKDDSISVKFVNCKLFNTRSLPGLFWLHLSRKYWSNWNTVRNCGEIQLNRCKKYSKRRSDPIWEELRTLVEFFWLSFSVKCLTNVRSCAHLRAVDCSGWIRPVGAWV